MRGVIQGYFCIVIKGYFYDNLMWVSGCVLKGYFYDNLYFVAGLSNAYLYF